MTEKEKEQRLLYVEKAGDFVENKIEQRIMRRYEAPVLDKAVPDPQVWYRIPLKEGISGDGSGYHIYLKRGTSENLCVFLSGGGVAWNEYTAARPVTGGKVAAGLPNFYWNNLRPFTQIMNINTGITEIGNPKNPFDAWNFIIITYATGDFHVGDCSFPYVDENGQRQTLHFHGYRNFRAGMEVSRQFFPSPEKLLIAGDSGGAFAVPALAGEIVLDYYPECEKVTLLSDSGLLLYKKWKKTAKEVWQAKESIWKPLHSANITLDWYRALYEKLGDRVNYLYANSTHDYLLSAYFNDVVNKTYKTNADVQEIFFGQLQDMVRQLMDAIPKMGFFFYAWKNFKMLQGGTVHTAVRRKGFFLRGHEGKTMAEWLGDAVDGNIWNGGMTLLEEGKKGRHFRKKRVEERKKFLRS